MKKSVELYEIIRLIRPVHRRLARAVEAKLEGTGVTVGMRAVMEVLEEAGPMAVPDIGRSLFPLTEAGHDRFGEIRARETDEIEKVCELFSDDDLRSTQGVLCTMLDHFAAFEDDPDRPRALE
jgi:hypothetical protein